MLAREALRTHPLRPRQPAILHIKRRPSQWESVPLLLRIDTPIEGAYFSAGRILTYVLNSYSPNGRIVMNRGAASGEEERHHADYGA